MRPRHGRPSVPPWQSHRRWHPDCQSNSDSVQFSSTSKSLSFMSLECHSWRPYAALKRIMVHKHYIGWTKDSTRLSLLAVPVLEEYRNARNFKLYDPASGVSGAPLYSCQYAHLLKQPPSISSRFLIRLMNSWKVSRIPQQEHGAEHTESRRSQNCGAHQP